MIFSAASASWRFISSWRWRYQPSGRAQGERAEIVLLAEADAVVAQDRVDVGAVEKEVRQRVLDEIVGAAHHFSFPARLSHDPGGCLLEVLRREAVEVLDHRAHAGAQLVERLLGI